MDRSYIAENEAERERLKGLLQRLSDEELSRPMPAGWTVAAVLAHMAFWDARALSLMDKWARGVVPSAADYEPEDIDWINDASKPLCLALARAQPRSWRSNWLRRRIAESRRCRRERWNRSLPSASRSTCHAQVTARNTLTTSSAT